MHGSVLYFIYSTLDKSITIKYIDYYSPENIKFYIFRKPGFRRFKSNECINIKFDIIF
jgi:hypothetical protein